MRFEEGQRYVNGLGRQLTIVAVDDVLTVDRLPVTVLAYRYDDGTIIHLRAAHKADNWEKVTPGSLEDRVAALEKRLKEVEKK